MGYAVGALMAEEDPHHIRGGRGRGRGRGGVSCCHVMCAHKWRYCVGAGGSLLITVLHLCGNSLLRPTDCACVCVRACVCACMHVRTYACMHMCTCADIVVGIPRVCLSNVCGCPQDTGALKREIALCTILKVFVVNDVSVFG